MTEGRPFRVRIHYQTSLCDTYRRRPTKTYSGTYEIVAVNQDEAVEEAVGRFRTTEALSAVSWPRTIVRVECDGVDV